MIHEHVTHGAERGGRAANGKIDEFEQTKVTAGRFAWAGALFMSVALTLSTRLVAARVLGDPWTWLVPAVVGALLLVAWWWVPLAHEARTYGGRDDT